MGPLWTFAYSLLILLLFEDATAGKAQTFYCDFGFCEADQYCCGDNKCCDKLLDLWYFWLGLGIVIIVVALVIFLKLCMRKKRSPSYKYSVLDQNQS